MARKLIDISVALQTGIASDPPRASPKIDYLDHHATASGIAEYFGIGVDQLPQGEYAAIERCEITTHNGTHLDAPYHFFSSMNHALKPGGEASMRIDELPLEWCFQPAVKLDFRHFEDGYVVTPADVQAELKRVGHRLRPLEIVVVNTRAGSRYGEADYVDAGCGMGKDATIWLLEQGIRLVGTDGWSWDAPFSHTKRKLEAGAGPELIWEGHRASREIGYSHLEKLHNLEVLPADGFQVVCFPVKIHRASAGWTRAVAILDE
ncbi:cyclase family protein [Bradyrhizobium australafricanum]|uniref:cyclase family protein n=1 Tax=Bradyrhizobium australafricanum TaxID=2821406 RepID=UPI001CE3967C|nr:cyclase family protein [Bradyrhizobium australafricanum]MCA6100540.1 cyclase family protein [Bradyrhizobium australafricanum]